MGRAGWENAVSSLHPPLGSPAIIVLIETGGRKSWRLRGVRPKRLGEPQARTKQSAAKPDPPDEELSGESGEEGLIEE
jgi:hypothetical protein